MWIPKDAVPYLLDETRELLADALARDDLRGWDPNDLIIWDGWVRTVLEDHPGGFDSAEMLDKGFGFLVGLIPGILSRRGRDMSPRAFGALAKIYHGHVIARALDWARRLDADDYEANLNLVRTELEAALEIHPRR